jgi:microcystin-dependent protein
LLACEDSGNYANGKTGGEATVTLATTQIPSHNHTFTGNSNTTSSVKLTSNGPSTNTSGGTALTTSGCKKSNNTSQDGYTTDAGGEYTITTSNITNTVTGNSSTGKHYSGPPLNWGGNENNNGNSLSSYRYTSSPLQPGNKNSGLYTDDVYRAGTTSTSFRTNNAGSHTHTVYVWARREGGISWDGNADHFSVGGLNEGGTSYASSSAGDHNHTVDISHKHKFDHVHSFTHSHDIKHSHDIPNHTHNHQHVHTIASHTHTLSNHTHTINAHTHTVTPTGSISSTGGGQAHNNMPPYLCVYMWKRTA